MFQQVDIYAEFSQIVIFHTVKFLLAMCNSCCRPEVSHDGVSEKCDASMLARRRNARNNRFAHAARLALVKL
jgi:hypothetical protein